MVVIAVAVIQGRIVGGTDDPIAFKQSHAEKQGQRHVSFDGSKDAGIFFHVLELTFDRGKTLVIHQIGFVQQQDVAIHHLRAAHLAFQQLVVEVLRIDQGDDRIKSGLIAELAAQEGHRHGQGIRQARGFHHEIVDGVGALKDAIHRFQKLAIDGATDAAVAQLDHVIAGADHQVVVDADLAKLIHQHRGFHPVLVGEDVIEKGGFACAKKACEDRHRHATGRHRSGAGGSGHGWGGVTTAPPRARFQPTMLAGFSPVGRCVRPG